MKLGRIFYEADVRLRQLERAWKESGSPEDKFKYYSALLRSGDQELSLKLQRMAALGDKVAMQILNNIDPIKWPSEMAAWENGTRFENHLRHVDDKELAFKVIDSLLLLTFDKLAGEVTTDDPNDLYWMMSVIYDDIIISSDGPSEFLKWHPMEFRQYYWEHLLEMANQGGVDVSAFQVQRKIWGYYQLPLVINEIYHLADNTLNSEFSQYVGKAFDIASMSLGMSGDIQTLFDNLLREIAN